MILYNRKFNSTPPKSFGITHNNNIIVLFKTQEYIFFDLWQSVDFVKTQHLPSSPNMQKPYKKKLNRNKNHYMNLRRSYGTKSTRW